MTEQEWRNCTDPAVVLEFLRSERKLRLFACACCRRIRHLLPVERARDALETAEAYADNLADKDPLQAAWTAVRKVRSVWPLFSKWEDALTAVINTASPVFTRTSALQAARAAAEALTREIREREGWAITEGPALQALKEEQAIQCAFLRDLYEPFHPVAVDSSWLRWRDGSVVQMAGAICTERRFGDLPVLADALEEAGCRDEHLLSHCRWGGEHIRGCWALDVVLGKA